MSRLTSWIAAIATIALLILLPAPASKAQESHDELEALIKQYLVAHPDEVGKSSKTTSSSTRMSFAILSST